MNQEDIAHLQASALIGFALTGNQVAFIEQLQTVENPWAVCNQLVRLFSKTVAPQDRDGFGQRMLDAIKPKPSAHYYI